MSFNVFKNVDSLSVNKILVSLKLLEIVRLSSVKVTVSIENNCSSYPNISKARGESALNHIHRIKIS